MASEHEQRLKSLISHSIDTVFRGSERGSQRNLQPDEDSSDWGAENLVATYVNMSRELQPLKFLKTLKTEV